MNQLSATQRDRLPESKFAYVDDKGNEKLPVHDEEHIRNAISRWSQTTMPDKAAKEKARKKLLSEAKKHGIEVAEDDDVRRKS